MADNKKEQERAELHRAIWSIANDLRGSVDGWDFKQYILGMLFYRYISENLMVYINRGEHEAGNLDFDYALLSDTDAEEARAGLVEEKGFFILPSELFCNVLRNAPQDENLNETLEKVFRNIEVDAQKMLSEPVPLVIRNAPTKLMKELHYGEGYEYAHDTAEKLTAMQCLPDSLAGKKYYRPTEQGSEARVKERLRQIEAWKAERRKK